MQNHRLSNPQRAALRRAIAAHTRWNEVRTAHGFNLAATSSSACINIANLLGLDWQAVVADATSYEPTPRRSNGVAGPAAWAQANLSRTGVTGEPQALVEPGGRIISYGPVVEPVAPSGATVDLSGILDDISRLTTGHVENKTAISRAREAFVALRDRIEAIEKATPREITVQIGASAPISLGKVTPHCMFEPLLRLCSTRVQGHRANIWMAGPAGSGKTTAAKMVAKALGLEFFARGAVSMPEDITGFVSPISQQYQSTPFVDMFAAGGVYLLDEADGSDANALLQLNAPLANGYISLPDGRTIERHPDFICIAAGNTWGEGPTAAYVGRTRLDAAFFDRFSFKLAWGYDRKLEAAMCSNKEWLARVWKARDTMTELEIKALVTPRCTLSGEQALLAGFSITEAEDMTYLATLTDDQKSSVRAALRGL